MDALTKYRKSRIKSLIDGKPYNGNQAHFARAAAVTKARITQLLDENESFGERAAKSLCDKLELPDRYFEVGFNSSDSQSASAKLTTGTFAERRQANSVSGATLEQILEGLSGYLVRLGPSDRRAAMQLIAGLEKEPERHAKVAAGIIATTDLGNHKQHQESPPKFTSSSGG